MNNMRNGKGRRPCAVAPVVIKLGQSAGWVAARRAERLTGANNRRWAGAAAAGVVEAAVISVDGEA